MNYSRIQRSDMSNGPGNRVSLFVSGCEHLCKGCFNQAAMRYEAGEPFTNDNMLEILKALESPYIDGFSLLGGDPLAPNNRETVGDIVRTVKYHLPLKSIWLWTGYYFDDIKDSCKDILNYIDVLVDGPYDKSLPAVRWRGSSNQSIYRRTNNNIFLKINEKMLDYLS